MRRFYDNQPLTPGQTTDLGPDASHHIGRVLRMQPGDTLTLFNGQGGEWQACITTISKKAVTVDVGDHHSDNRTAPMAVTVALPLIKGERMDYALQKATELGAAQFQLLTTERTDVRLDGDRLDKKLRHWQQVVISACEQCGMNQVPTVQAPQTLPTFLADCDTPLRLIAHPGEQSLPASALTGRTSLTLLTGPEGGFSDQELLAAREAGFQAFALGNRVLRAETAPTALLAALWVMLG
ncbi:MAG: 16S rRNA (uracil(1498)-N(3))-methyltransferase [Alcanivorax sp.]|nr:16S rRNA (uracil(1498)-N(3))-methyltransferase [Alcanivorax sp.]